MGNMATAARRLEDGRVLLYAVHNGAAPSKEDWSAYLALAKRELGRKGDRGVALVLTDGGAPDAAQRRQVLETRSEISGSDLPTSVVSDSTVVRGVVTALTWLSGAPIEVFSPSSFDGALKYLSIGESDLPAIASDLERLAAELPEARTARAVAAAIRDR